MEWLIILLVLWGVAAPLMARRKLSDLQRVIRHQSSYIQFMESRTSRLEREANR